MGSECGGMHKHHGHSVKQETGVALATESRLGQGLCTFKVFSLKAKVVVLASGLERREICI